MDLDAFRRSLKDSEPPEEIATEDVARVEDRAGSAAWSQTTAGRSRSDPSRTWVSARTRTRTQPVSQHPDR